MTHLRQRGVALLVAITIFAIATTLAAAITYNKAMAARRAAATFTLEQALQAGMAAEALADIALEADGSSAKTSPDQQWAQALGPIEIEGTGVWIQAQLECQMIGGQPSSGSTSRPSVRQTQRSAGHC